MILLLKILHKIHTASVPGSVDGWVSEQIGRETGRFIGRQTNRFKLNYQLQGHIILLGVRNITYLVGMASCTYF